MNVPEIMRFYNYSLDAVMSLYAVSFFALVSAMHRIKAGEIQELSVAVSLGMSGDESTRKALEEQEEGVEGILREARMIRGLRNGK